MKYSYVCGKQCICDSCWCRVYPEKKLKWNAFIWFLLYVFIMIIWWIIYSIRRRSDCEAICPNCWSNMLKIAPRKKIEEQEEKQFTENWEEIIDA